MSLLQIILRARLRRNRNGSFIFSLVWSVLCFFFFRVTQRPREANSQNKQDVTFRFPNEDHSLADLLGLYMDRDQDVCFYGCHPQRDFETFIDIDVTTNQTSLPIDALERACTQARRDFKQLEDLFRLQ